ncbi:MAG: hypothetical protein ACXW0J_02775 [Nitrososphaeraceae archaeon]
MKFPFCSKVWRLSLLNSDWNCSNDDPIDVDDYTVEYEDCDPILSPDYKRGYDNGYVIGREEGELAASCNELTVKDLIKDSIDDGDFALVQQLTFKLIQNNQI